MSGTKRKNIDRMTPRELKEEVKRLRHQVSRRGYTIGGLYAALRYAIDGNPNVYHVNPNEGVVQGLLNAVEKAEVRRDDIPINELKNISNLPDGFACK